MTPTPAELLLALTRRALDGPRPDAPLAAPPAAGPGPGPADWRPLLALARREGVAPLLAGIADALPAAPAAWRQALAAEYRRSAGRAVLHAETLGHALAALDGVEVLVLKGLALAEPLYGDAARRPMNDVDLLVRRADVGRAASALARLGYRPAGDLAADLAGRGATALRPPASPAARPVIDLHWDLVERWYGARAGAWPAGVWRRARELTLDGCRLRVLAPGDALLHACVHLAGNHGLRGLLWYCDLHLMARRWAGDLEWDELVAAARAARLEGLVWAPLAVVRAALDLEVPDGVLTALGPARRARLFVAWLLPRLLALRTLPAHDYVVPLFLVGRRRDLAAVILRRAAAALAAPGGRRRRPPGRADRRAVAAAGPSR